MAKSAKGSGRKTVKVIRQTKSGRNTGFRDGSKNMTRSQFVKEIKSGNYKGYTVKNINGIQTPVSKPDRSSGNNLG